MEDGTKEIDLEAIRRSVQDVPSATNGVLPSLQSTILWAVGQVTEEFTPWGRDTKRRDRELREFITTEPIFASALGIVCSRNSAFSWSLDGPEAEVRKYQRILEASNFGRGWIDLMIKVSMDLYTQDSGAFIEVVRERNEPEADILALNSLDAARCYHTGAPMAPVIYQDRKGKYHLLRWWQVIPLAEMPAAIEGYYGMQYCTLSRLLRAAQILKNVSIYDYERTGGRHTRAIHLVRGITGGQIQDAINEMTIRLNSRGMQRYSQPLIVGSVDPKADIGHDTIELASLPDNFDRETAFKWYVSQIAMAFLEDYQSFAPLPGGNLGSSQQSEVLHAKARGKGPALFRSLITHAFNFMVFPESLRFEFDEQDLAEEKELAAMRQVRATERQIRINDGEISPDAARQLALDAGDLPEELFESLGGYDITPDVQISGGSSPDSQLGAQNAPRVRPSRPIRPVQRANPGAQTVQPIRQSERSLDEEPEEEPAYIVEKTVTRDSDGRIAKIVEIPTVAMKDLATTVTSAMEDLAAQQAEQLEKASKPRRTEREVVRDEDGRIIRIIEVAS